MVQVIKERNKCTYKTQNPIKTFLNCIFNQNIFIYIFFFLYFILFVCCVLYYILCINMPRGWMNEWMNFKKKNPSEWNDGTHWVIWRFIFYQWKWNEKENKMDKRRHTHIESSLSTLWPSGQNLYNMNGTSLAYFVYYYYYYCRCCWFEHWLVELFFHSNERESKQLQITTKHTQPNKCKHE